MFDLALRPAKDRLLAPVADRLGGIVSAGTLTAVGLATSLAAAAGAAVGQRWWPLALWLAGRTVDGLDGLVARRRGQAGDLGGYLDMLADAVAYVAVPLGVVLGDGATAAWAALAVLLGSFYLNAISWAYLSALLEKRGQGVATSGEETSTRMPTGLVEGAETIVFFSAFLVWPRQAVALFTAMAVLVVTSVAQRLWWSRQNLTSAAGVPRPTGPRPEGHL